jgi:alkylation response protein AidB-like acyl-CoA dehydrogenase
MSTTAVDPDLARIDAELDALLSECDPKKVDNATFRGARFDRGLAWVHFPVGHGGLNMRPDLNRRVEDRLRTAGAAPQDPATFFIALAGPTIVTHGSEEVKKRFLRPMFTGEEVWCQLFSEPGAGSDLGSLSTRADRDGDRFIINGQKVWCSGGRCSNWGILMARTDFDAKKHEGISFFLIPMDLPGIDVRPLKQMTGESEFDEVFFTDVELPAEYLIGPLNGGWGVGMAVLTN